MRVDDGPFGGQGQQLLRVLREELVDGRVEADEDGEGVLWGWLGGKTWIC